MEETIEATWTLSKAALMACLHIFNGVLLMMQYNKLCGARWVAVAEINWC